MTGKNAPPIAAFDAVQQISTKPDKEIVHFYWIGMPQMTLCGLKVVRTSASANWRDMTCRSCASLLVEHLTSVIQNISLNLEL